MELRTTSATLRAPALPGDVGYNLPALNETFVEAQAFATVATGVHVEIPEGYFGLILPRSSTNLGGKLIVLTGVIDNGYRGELRALVHNMDAYPVRIAAGEAICQLVLLPAVVFPVTLVEHLTPSARGHNGFGSTGR